MLNKKVNEFQAAFEGKELTDSEDEEADFTLSYRGVDIPIKELIGKEEAFKMLEPLKDTLMEQDREITYLKKQLEVYKQNEAMFFKMAEHEAQQKKKMLEQTYQIFVDTIDGRAVVTVEKDDTVELVKFAVEDQKSIPVDQQRLIFAGKQLEDVRTMDYYNIQREAVLFCVMRLKGGGKRARIALASLGPQQGDPPAVIACFGIAEFRGRQWLRSLSLEVLKDYQEKFTNQRNFDRQITTTMDFINEMRGLKDWLFWMIFNSQRVGS